MTSVDAGTSAEQAPRPGDAIPIEDVPEFKCRRQFGAPLTCRLRIFVALDQRRVVLVSESPGNRGPSIMSMAEAIATDVARSYALDPVSTIFIEHYDDRAWRATPRGERDAGGLRRRDGAEDFDRVRFTVLADDASLPLLADPRWEPIRKHQLERLLGGSLP